jgi:O-antigen ligase
MNPSVALSLCFIFIIYLFWINYKKIESNISPYLWLPCLWFGIYASRPISFWFGVGSVIDSSDAIMEGSPFDRIVFLSLIIIGLAILLKIKAKIANVAKKNVLILIFILYLGLSILWSDYPFVSFKRYIKELGNVIMILIIISESNPSEAFKTMIMRLAYVLIPLSMVFNKYFPHIGRMWSISGGDTQYTGITIHKNSLGMLCLICGLVILGNLLTLWRAKDVKIDKQVLFLHLSLLLLVVWLLYMANSATAILCSIVGAIMIFILGTKTIKRNPRAIKYYVLVLAMILITIHLSVDITSTTTQSLGRDETLTGRTQLWDEILAMKTNPLIGTGYQSFWLGERREWFHNKYWWRPNQAHNAYLELYINIGLIGIFLFLLCVIKAFINSYKHLITLNQYEHQTFRLTFIILFLLTSWTEAYSTGLVWMTMLFVLFEIPNQDKIQTTSQPPVIS